MHIVSVERAGKTKKKQGAKMTKAEAAKLKAGDKVKTIYGKIETVTFADDMRVFTRENGTISWYHPTKVWAA